jgi:hypothetical protein
MIIVEENSSVTNFAADQSYYIYPAGRNEILARFENLDDRFDDEGRTMNVDMQKFALDLF